AAPPHAATASSLVEPLTAREREVLQLVLDGASNREIACRLIVTVNTVKKHIMNIYGKLNVRSRVQAIMKAQALHLLKEQGSERAPANGLSVSFFASRGDS